MQLLVMVIVWQRAETLGPLGNISSGPVRMRGKSNKTPVSAQQGEPDNKPLRRQAYWETITPRTERFSIVVDASRLSLGNCAALATCFRLTLAGCMNTKQVQTESRTEPRMTVFEYCESSRCCVLSIVVGFEDGFLVCGRILRTRPRHVFLKYLLYSTVYTFPVSARVGAGAPRGDPGTSGEARLGKPDEHEEKKKLLR